MTAQILVKHIHKQHTDLEVTSYIREMLHPCLTGRMDQQFWVYLTHVYLVLLSHSFSVRVGQEKLFLKLAKYLIPTYFKVTNWQLSRTGITVASSSQQ